MGLGFGVWGLRFRVWGLGFGVWGLRFRVWGLGLGFRVWGLGVLMIRILLSRVLYWGPILLETPI